MRTRIYLSLFILCCIFSQVISFLSEENNDPDESANLHVRKKRVLDKTPGGDQPQPIEKIPYIVSIGTMNQHQCAASILSPNIIITAAHCVLIPGEYLYVFSGSAFATSGTRHNITGVHFFPAYTRTSPETHDFALLTIYPFIDFHRSPNRPIKLQREMLSLDTVGIVSGWGSHTEPPNHIFPGSLRSITLPLIARVTCQRYYRNIIIDEKKFCTFDFCDQKACGYGDSGNPFVVDGYLVGIHSGSGRVRHNRRSPEVYMNLCDREYNEWIHRQIELLQPNEHIAHNPIMMNRGHPQHNLANLHDHQNHFY